MRDRRPEQRHEPIAEELVDRALIPVHLGQRDPEKPVDHQVKVLRPQLRCQRARPHDVAEQDAHLLALTLDRAPHRQDLLADVPRGVTGRRWRRRHRAPASGAEPGIRRQRRAAASARNAQLCTTMHTEPRLAGIVMAALRASHRRPPPGHSAPGDDRSRATNMPLGEATAHSGEPRNAPWDIASTGMTRISRCCEQPPAINQARHLLACGPPSGEATSS